MAELALLLASCFWLGLLFSYVLSHDPVVESGPQSFAHVGDRERRHEPVPQLLRWPSSSPSSCRGRASRAVGLVLVEVVAPEGGGEPGESAPSVWGGTDSGGAASRALAPTCASSGAGCGAAGLCELPMKAERKAQLIAQDWWVSGTAVRQFREKPREADKPCYFAILLLVKVRLFYTRIATDRHIKRRQNTALHSISLSSSYRAAADIACSCTAQRGQNCLSQLLAACHRGAGASSPGSSSYAKLGDLVDGSSCRARTAPRYMRKCRAHRARAARAPRPEPPHTSTGQANSHACLCVKPK